MSAGDQRAGRRRTFAEVAEQAIVNERAGVIEAAVRAAAGAKRHRGAGKLTAAEAEAVQRAVLALAEHVAIGLHTEFETSAQVRARLRPVMARAGLMGTKGRAG